MLVEEILNMLEPSTYNTDVMGGLNMEIRLKRIAKRQMDSASMFSRLQVIIDQLEENFQPPTTISEQLSPKGPAFLSDHNYALSNTSSGVLSASFSPTPASGPSSSSSLSDQQNNRFNRYHRGTAKRKIIDDDEDGYHEFSAEDENTVIAQDEDHQIYPQQIGENVILGPNGTQVDSRSYSSIIWSSAASATRQLLGFVFSSDVLATHTLTGKPSPAFYGRERPAKMQLDPIKAADIIHCVRSQFKCTEREIRAAITTKCSDTSKKYKRRHQKQIESSSSATH
ncbi:early boundary activity 2 [Cochliomyia hominivorax]